MLTFKQWRETRREVTDLSTVQSDESLVGIHGLAYEGGYIIEKHKIKCDVCTWAFFLQLGRDSWLCSDLKWLEGKLYAYARREGGI